MIFTSNPHHDHDQYQTEDADRHGGGDACGLLLLFGEGFAFPAPFALCFGRFFFLG